jgi:dihydropteroate synthase
MKIKLTKIDLDEFLSVLEEMYEQGLDYIDIAVTSTDEGVEMEVSYEEDYFSEEARLPLEDNDTIEDDIKGLEDLA